MTVFWRVDYEGNLDKQFMLDRGELAWPRAVSTTDRQKIGKRMRVGHGVVMGRAAGKIGRIEAIGHITEIASHPQKKWVIHVEWQAIQPKVIHPESSGVTKWKRYPVFKFDSEPAERYKLAELLETHSAPDVAATASDQDEIDTQPITDLVRAVLASIDEQLDADVTDTVCLAIENTPSWKQTYDAIVDGIDTDDPSGFVNKQIGKAVKSTLGWVTLSEGNRSQTDNLIQSYARLGPSK